jgi:hypothetical protein
VSAPGGFGNCEHSVVGYYYSPPLAYSNAGGKQCVCTAFGGITRIRIGFRELAEPIC